MTTPHILIIIVTWNKKQYVLELLASLATLDSSSYTYDVLVIDNASSDGTAAAIKAAYPQIKLICNPENIGGTGGFNTGLQWAFEQSHYQYLWLLDNDVLVHHRALAELLALLEKEPDIAIAGSTMMQLDYPWRVNEMGAFIDRGLGQLFLNRHLEEIPAWQGRSVQELLTTEVDLSKYLMHCQPEMDIEYVAAASLLVRADVAKQAGLWRDYFIHFDDVEWCLRIAEMGHRVVVSAKSLIWHLSAAAKVPTWVLYYDNRNVLDFLKTHGAEAASLQRLIRYILKKAVYYNLIGKPDLARLHYEAITDFTAGNLGKKDIKLLSTYQPNNKVMSVLLEPTVKNILVAWTVNLQATGLQKALVQAIRSRPELSSDFLTLPGGKPLFQIPHANFVIMPKNFSRWKTYWQLRGRYDLVIQSDYQPSYGLSWLKADLLYVNDEGFCRYPSPKFKDVWRAVMRWIRTFFVKTSRA
jgi:GT2 family glycosyltransferase